jgi:hypothetical protein
MPYFVVGEEANVVAPCAAAGGGAVGDQRYDIISTVAGRSPVSGQLHIFLGTTID